MNKGMTPDKSYKKSARIVGDVMGKYHPHGDLSIYEAMVTYGSRFQLSLSAC
ncbi:DNA gyrase subunit A [Streptomyces murinus]|uniref:DNA gyrase subunit A n=1 Tax=Streptomyces murinus TaxID=33900 RepID=UPI003F47BBBA